MQKMDIGMVGMAVMGSNMALNMADHGFEVACYNYTSDLTKQVMKEHPHKCMHGFYDLQEFVESLKKPRKIMFLIMAGKPVDEMISQLLPLLEQGDILLDGGNSFFEDTRRRHDFLETGHSLLWRGHIWRRKGCQEWSVYYAGGESRGL